MAVGMVVADAAYWKENVPQSSKEHDDAAAVNDDDDEKEEALKR